MNRLSNPGRLRRYIATAAPRVSWQPVTTHAAVHLLYDRTIRRVCPATAKFEGIDGLPNFGPSAVTHQFLFLVQTVVIVAAVVRARRGAVHTGLNDLIFRTTFIYRRRPFRMYRNEINHFVHIRSSICLSDRARWKWPCEYSGEYDEH